MTKTNGAPSELPNPPRPRSQYRNVFWAGYKHKTKPWGVRIHVRNSISGKQFVNLGYYEEEETAGRVADVGLILIHGADAIHRLNFDGKPPDSVPKAWILNEIRRRLFTVSPHQSGVQSPPD